MHFHVLAMNNVRPHLSHDQSLHSTSHVTVAYCLQFPSSRAIANNGLSTTSNHPYVVATSKTKPNNTFYATTTVAMDRRQFMPRYTADKVVNNSGIIEPAKLPRAPRAPPRTAPPILPPRNPKRLGLAPRSPEKVAQSWDPTYRANPVAASHPPNYQNPLQRRLSPNNLSSAQSQQTLSNNTPLLLPSSAPPNAAKTSVAPCTRKSRICANRTSTCRATMSSLLLCRRGAAFRRLR
jgi:hypothetical protein